MSAKHKTRNTKPSINGVKPLSQNTETSIPKKDMAKAYEKYSKQFTPKPRYFMNSFRAFLIGGAICTFAFYFSSCLKDSGLSEKTAGTYTTIMLVSLAQILTGLGVFDTIGKFAGAGVIVPITGYANSIVASALEYKREGPVLGIGAKIFSVAGPVLVCGITSATLVGIIYWIFYQF